ncbi:MAG: AAA family ATPase, partial [Merdibacter sp.]
MYQEYARLVVYRGFPADSIFRQLCSIIREFDEGSAPKYELIDRIHAQIKALLDLSTECGFDGDLWHCYLTWLLMTHENS